MKNIILEELSRIKFLEKYRRGVVISEQTKGEVVGGSRKYTPIGVPDWNDKSRGQLSFNTQEKIHAKNVDFEGETYSITSFSSIGKKVAKPSPTISQSTGTELPKVSFTDDFFPYDDNMISPNFNKNPKAFDMFNEFINSIIKMVNRHGLNSISEIQVQGSADSSKPNFKVPSGYSKLDHDIVSQKPYNGSTDPFTMNQFLADNRAKTISNILINTIKDKTGVDIGPKVKLLKGINYYNPNSTSNTGVKSVTFNVIKGNLPPIDDTTIDGSGTPGTVTPKSGELDLSQWGGPKVQYTEVIDDKGHVSYGIKPEVTDSLRNDNIISVFVGNRFNGKSTVDGRIKNGKLIVDGLDFGNLVPPSDNSATDVSFETNPGRYIIYGDRDGLDLIRILRFGLTKL